jgi:hypothetical protein
LVGIDKSEPNSQLGLVTSTEHCQHPIHEGEKRDDAPAAGARARARMALALAVAVALRLDGRKERTR